MSHPENGSAMGSRWRVGTPLLGLLAGWVALFAWSGMVAQPSGFLVWTLLIGLLIVLLGSGLRVKNVPAYGVALAQVALGLLALNTLFAAKQSLLGVIPTQESVRRLVFVIDDGAATLNHYTAPVEINAAHTQAMLVACGLAVVLSIDVLAMGLRRPPLVALPLLITLSVPVSILNDALAFPVFIGTALLFLRLLASENLDRFRHWGDRASSTTGPSKGPTGLTLTTFWQVAVAAVVVALLTASIVPVTNLLDRGDQGGSGDGAGADYRLMSSNPTIRLQRDLLEKTHTPLLYARTKASSTGYLRTAVLDDFTGDSWHPSTRSLPRRNDANGTLPSPPGLAAGTGGAESKWSFQLAPGFSTTWLPLPYPLRSLDVPGDWRYDTRTLDVVRTGGPSIYRMQYHATAFAPTITADLLDTKIRAPEEIREEMTKVPKELPAVIEQQARKVTRGADTDFAKAVALQDWFREDGGFRYSLEQRSGSGMDLLASFVTDDRVGYCEQFAAAMATMGRTLGIPSRVVVGFLRGTTQDDGQILYTSDDRHAWPEMYFYGLGWVRFEPTPGDRVSSTPSWTRESADAPDPSVAPSAAASPAPVAPRDQAPTDVDTDSGHGIGVPWWSVVLLLVVLLLGVTPALVRQSQRRRRLAGRDLSHLTEGAWAELRATALDLGLDWPEQRSPREQARTMVAQVQAQEDELRSLEGLLVRVEQGRFGRSAGAGAVDADTRARTVETVGSWRKVMQSGANRAHGRRGRLSRLWPVSLLRRKSQ